jgi:hypothetical protein
MESHQERTAASTKEEIERKKITYHEVVGKPIGYCYETGYCVRSGVQLKSRPKALGGRQAAAQHMNLSKYMHIPCPPAHRRFLVCGSQVEPKYFNFIIVINCIGIQSGLEMNTSPMRFERT